MSEFKTNEKKLPDGTTIKTFSKTITLANILEVEAGTNGCQGGDAGHGCRTYFRIEDLGGTDMQSHNYLKAYGCKGFEVMFGGDSELETVITGLEFIVDVLKKNRVNKVNDFLCDDDTRSDKYKAILERDANKRMQEYCLQEYDIDSFPHISLFVDWCWRHNAGHWPDGTPIGDD